MFLIVKFLCLAILASTISTKLHNNLDVFNQ
jgi:hypothetical protein